MDGAESGPAQTRRAGQTVSGGSACIVEQTDMSEMSPHAQPLMETASITPLSLGADRADVHDGRASQLARHVAQGSVI